MTLRNRPKGITFLSVANFLAATPLLMLGTVFLTVNFSESVTVPYPIAFWILLGGTPFIVVAQGLGLLDAITAGGDLWAQMMGIDTNVGGTIFVLFGAFNVVMGVGLWKCRHWAWIISVVLAPLNFLISLLFIQYLLLPPYAGITWYMFRPSVKNAFGTPPKRTRSK